MPKTTHGMAAYQGEIAALVSSLAIAITPYFFIHGYSQKCSPYILNFWKGLISILLFIVLLIATQQQLFPEDSFRTYALLIASGFFGIGLGDTFYFQAFETLGPRWAVLLETITPSFTGIISYIYYSTTLTVLQWIGMIITGLGIYLVAHVSDQQNIEQEQLEINQKQQDLPIQQIIQKDQQADLYKTRLDEDMQTQDQIVFHNENSSKINIIANEILVKDKTCQIELINQRNKYSKEFLLGILKGLGFAFCQAFGMVFAHDAAVSGKFTPLETTFLRVLTGQLYVTLIMVFTCDRLHWPSKNTEESLYYLAGIASCSILGIWAQQTSLKFIRPEVAQTIIATSPLFSLFIGCLREDKIHIKDILGSLISIIGVSMVIWL
ncbi:integral membrane protein DUF6 containing protein (macronuclear) [Tetrahymena thermophila SB210]|uniref:Integral membrane protein DUF6 containing protein n=1 Tax=Tetrahymena thermophila (strain SB210) TaxID=312017 RepID=I7MMQ0_TETTS|nr:integral membrane protein DUF6 containing protein [Tetrahymena thermophila SB210]EAS06177.1 integral membrane protein DUF6 containing protein [Tetrahymena thermophila SB210]|eukprot:XP_001026422.1 integral membrane protein DUF6 containing protein [Tetrahymena thermophila SB210]